MKNRVTIIIDHYVFKTVIIINDRKKNKGNLLPGRN